jgi:hypothetical protein
VEEAILANALGEAVRAAWIAAGQVKRRGSVGESFVFRM